MLARLKNKKAIRNHRLFGVLSRVRLGKRKTMNFWCYAVRLLPSNLQSNLGTPPVPSDLPTKEWYRQGQLPTLKNFTFHFVLASVPPYSPEQDLRSLNRIRLKSIQRTPGTTNPSLDCIHTRALPILATSSQPQVKDARCCGKTKGLRQRRNMDSEEEIFLRIFALGSQGHSFSDIAISFSTHLEVACPPATPTEPRRESRCLVAQTTRAVVPIPRRAWI